MPSASAPKTAKQTGAEVRAYLASLPPESRRTLKQLREAIRAAAPDASEAFSYKIPGFRLDGKPLFWYAGWKQHSGLYPVSDSLKRAFASELEGYETSKGTLRFPLERPLPLALVKRLVKARMAELRRKG